MEDAAHYTADDPKKLQGGDNHMQAVLWGRNIFVDHITIIKI